MYASWLMSGNGASIIGSWLRDEGTTCRSPGLGDL